MSIGVKIFRVVIAPLQRLPLGFHYRAGRVVAWFAKSVLRYRRDLVTVNLSRSFPHKKWKEVMAVSDDFYSHFGDIFAEALWFGGCRWNVGRLHRSGLCSVANPEVLLDACADGQSVMLLASHMGNWEIMGGLLEYLPQGHGIASEELVVTYKKLKNDFWDEFIGLNRSSVLPCWNGYQESGNVLRYALGNRRNRRIYIFIGDQFPYRGATRHEIPDFMNQPTVTMNGGVMLAAKLHMPVIYYGMKRVGKGRYEIGFKKICDDAATMEANAVMAEFYSLLEKDINSDPGNYLWSHNRWKQ